MIKQFLWLFIALLCACGDPEQTAVPSAPPARIVSLAPNITETLYDLGLEERLAGASRFGTSDTDPGLAIVGDFMNVNYEAIVALKPDLVILEKSSDTQKARLQTLGIDYLETGSLTIAEILESVQLIGEKCGAREQASELIAQMNKQMNDARNQPAHRPRTLIAFSDFSNQSKVDQVYAFGSGCIHSELLAIAGGDNVVKDARPSVTLSSEAVIRLNPELIIELSAGGPTNHWNNLQSIDAVRNNNIHVLTGTYTTIPSPTHLMHTLEDFSEIIKRNGSGE